MIQQIIISNRIGDIEPMQLIEKEGVTLAYQDTNPGSPPILFVHGWGCDHTAFAPQAEFFRHSPRVVSVDLRGHGKSDALQSMVEGLRGPDYRAAYQEGLLASTLPSDGR